MYSLYSIDRSLIYSVFVCSSLQNKNIDIFMTFRWYSLQDVLIIVIIIWPICMASWRRLKGQLGEFVPPIFTECFGHTFLKLLPSNAKTGNLKQKTLQRSNSVRTTMTGNLLFYAYVWWPNYSQPMDYITAGI